MEKKKEELSFEDSIKKLESIVKKLENGDVLLDDAINKFNEACKIANICDKKLKQKDRILHSNLYNTTFSPFVHIKIC